LDPRLIVVTDRNMIKNSSNIPFLEVVRSVAFSGATMIQLREKNIESMDFLKLADNVREVLRGSDCSLIINDRLDIALVSDAKGVHFGQDDYLLPRAKKLVGSNFIFGVSASNPDLAEVAIRDGANYIGVGPAFSTKSKQTSRIPIGPEGLMKIVDCFPDFPIVGIGGINIENIEQVLESGVSGVAVIAAIMSSSSPEKVCKQMRKVIDRVIK